MKARAKTIQLLLSDGTLNGVICIADSLWNSGKLYAAPRESIEELLGKDDCKNYGVYLLISNEKVYIGQASDLAHRVKQHVLSKEWWDRAILLTTDNNSFNKSDIDYLEASLIEKAEEIGSLDSDNKQKGNKKKVGEFREVGLDQYIEEALFLMELIGVSVFCKKKNNTAGLGSSMKSITPSERSIQSKTEARKYLSDQGLTVFKHANYAKRIEDKPVYWLNPRVEQINNDWSIILNDQFKYEITLINVPAKSLALAIGNGEGLKARTDRTELINMLIDAETLIDSVSGIDFSRYERTTIKYI